MKKAKTTKRALLSSVLALVLCMSMFMGTTFAWFTDSVTSANNIITSGNLDMKVSYKPYGAENTTWTEVGAEPILGVDAKYEPGYTEAVWLKVENAGSLAFKYIMNLTVNSETAGVNKAGDPFKLSDYIKVKAMTTTSSDMESSFYTTRESLSSFAWGLAGSIDTDLKSGNIELSKSVATPDAAAIYVLVILEMPTSVGNEANHNGKDIPKIDLGITAIATQVPAESDSFGTGYDANADYVAYFTSGTHELNMSLKATKATDVITASGVGTVVNIIDGTYDAGSQECVVWAKDGAIVNISGGTFVHDGTGTPASSAHHYDMIYAGANGGKIVITGGTFYARSAGVWLLNEKDNQGEIVVKGGRFLNWNPANNVSEGANTSFLADGYTVVAEPAENGDVWYVVREQAANEVLVTPNDNVSEVIKNMTATQDTVILLAGKYDDTIVAKSNITILGTEGAVVDSINLNGSDNITIKNVAFDAAGAEMGYNGSGNTVQPANIVTGTASSSLGKGAYNVVIDGCTFTGTFVDGGGCIAFTDQDRGTGGSKNITVKNCTFDTEGGYFDVYTFYSGNNGTFVIENNTFASHCYNPVYLGRYQSSVPVEVTNNKFETVANLNAAVYLQAHSEAYTVSLNATNNTFGA